MPPTDSRAQRLSFAIYLRVSTDVQVQEGYSLGTQEHLCREYIDRKVGDTPCDIKVYREEGKSGSYTVRQLRKGNQPIRPVLSDLVDDAESGEITHIVVYELSRMSREFDDWIMIHRLLLQPAAVRVWVVQNDLDLADEDDEFVGNPLALVSDRERKLIRRRIIDARQSRLRDGYPPGGHAPHGWRWESRDQAGPGVRRNIEPDPEEAKWVHWMAERIMQDGWGVTRVAKELFTMGIESSAGKCRWTGPEVWYRVRHEAHAGLLKNREGELVKAAYYDKRLWEPEFREALIDEIASRCTFKGKTASTEDWPLLGILTCGHCGRPLRAMRSRTGQRFYRCERPELGSPHECPGIMRRAGHVEAQVTRLLSELVNSPTMSTLVGEEAARLIDREQTSARASLKKVESDLRDLDARLEKIALAYTDGKMSAVQFEKVSAQWQETYGTLTEQRRMLETKADAGTAQRLALQSVETGLRSFVQVWDKAGPARQRELLNSILEWLRLVPEDTEAGFAELRMKLHLLPEMSAPVPRSQTKNMDAEGVDRLSLRGLAFLAHLADGRSKAEAARLLGVCDVTDQLQILRETAGIDDLEELIEAARPRIEALRAMLPMGEPPAKAGDDERPPVTPRTQEICELYASGMTQAEIGSRLGILSTSVGVALLDARRSIQLWLDRHNASPEDLPAALRYVFEVRRRRPRPKPLTMTPRLQQVLDLVEEGLSDEEIAKRMDLGLRCVPVYRSKAKKRLEQVAGAAAQSAAG